MRTGKKFDLFCTPYISLTTKMPIAPSREVVETWDEDQIFCLVNPYYGRGHQVLGVGGAWREKGGDQQAADVIGRTWP